MSEKAFNEVQKHLPPSLRQSSPIEDFTFDDEMEELSKIAAHFKAIAVKAESIMDYIGNNRSHFLAEDILRLCKEGKAKVEMLAKAKNGTLVDLTIH